MAITVKAYAKLNLTLEIVGTEDGYHLLDSLVTSVDVFDSIHLKKRKDTLSRGIMHGLGSESIPPEHNNALKAAEAFSKKFHVNGADITIYKNIPIGAGMGGSSADISGVLNGMAKLYGIEDEEEIASLADCLGSDTRYLLRGGAARMQGRGEKIQFLDDMPTLYFLLIYPETGVSSGACYRQYDQMQIEKNFTSATENCIKAWKDKDIKGVGRYLMNDLFLPAATLLEDVKTAMEEGLSFSPDGAVMTGSGSCVAVLFESKELCDWAKSRYRGKYKTMVVKTVNPSKLSVWKNPFVL